MKVTMSWANISLNGKLYVNNVLDRGWLSYSLYMPRFEKEVAERHGAKFGVLVNSGTDALRISLATLKEFYKWPSGSSVIVPALTFVATVNAVLQNQLKPVFQDVGLTDANLIWNEPKKAVAAVPVHLFGLPSPIPKTKLKVVEDSCETFGVHKIQGDLMCLSFYMSHHVMTGVGGMILTNNPQYEKIARSYQNHGRIDDGTHFRFGRSGYSSRITEMEAALGLAALEHFDDDLKKRRVLASLYFQQLDLIPELHQPAMSQDHSWMFFPVRLQSGSRDKLLQHLKKNGIESREAMPLINQPVFKALYKQGSCPNAENWTRNGLLLPLHPQMTDKDVEYIGQTIRTFYK